MNELIYAFGEAFARILMVALAGGGGFLIGWLLSPHSAGLRRTVMWVIATALVLCAVFMNNALGWSIAWLLAVIAFFAGVSFWVAKAAKSFFETPTTFGSSRWATPDDVRERKLVNEGGIRIGNAHDGSSEKLISYKGDRHLLTVAPTRSGKGTTQIIPNLLTYDGSMLVIDPKGENALITAKRRQEMGQEVHIVDP